jgi:hypothetical protein
LRSPRLRKATAAAGRAYHAVGRPGAAAVLVYLLLAFIFLDAAALVVLLSLWLSG